MNNKNDELHILNYLPSYYEEIEKEYDINLLFVSLYGSRFYNINSNISDYDFIVFYRKTLDCYLTIQNISDSIEIKKILELKNNITYNLEFKCWDIKKVIELAYKYNPTLFEIILCNNIKNIFLDRYNISYKIQCLMEIIDYKTLYKSYINKFNKIVTKNEYENDFEIKDLIYLFMNLFKAIYIKEYLYNKNNNKELLLFKHKRLPINFEELVNNVINIDDNNISYYFIKHLIKYFKERKNKDNIIIPIFDDIRNFIQDSSEYYNGIELNEVEKLNIKYFNSTLYKCITM